MIAVVAGAVMAFGYVRRPQCFSGSVATPSQSNCPRQADSTTRANVTYRGTEVGQVKSDRTDGTGVEAVLR